MKNTVTPAESTKDERVTGLVLTYYSGSLTLALFCTSTALLSIFQSDTAQINSDIRSKGLTPSELLSCREEVNLNDTDSSSWNTTVIHSSGYRGNDVVEDREQFCSAHEIIMAAGSLGIVASAVHGLTIYFVVRKKWRLVSILYLTVTLTTMIPLLLPLGQIPQGGDGLCTVTRVNPTANRRASCFTAYPGGSVYFSNTVTLGPSAVHNRTHNPRKNVIKGYYFTGYAFMIVSALGTFVPLVFFGVTVCVAGDQDHRRHRDTVGIT